MKFCLVNKIFLSISNAAVTVERRKKENTLLFRRLTIVIIYGLIFQFNCLRVLPKYAGIVFFQQFGKKKISIISIKSIVLYYIFFKKPFFIYLLSGSLSLFWGKKKIRNKI